MRKYPRKEEKAIVLSAHSYGEDSARITLAGEERGVFSLMANHVYKPKSPLRPLLMVGSLLLVQYKEVSPSLCVCSSLSLLEDSSPLWTERKGLAYLLFLSELSLCLFHYGDKFPLGERKEILSERENGGDVLSLSLLTRGSFYRALGLERNTKSCVHCGGTENISAYSFAEGGFLCLDCAEKRQIPSVKDKRDLYVLKFAFLPLSDSLLKKKVPFVPGRRILLSLLENLRDYFDLKPRKSWSFFQSSLQD